MTETPTPAGTPDSADPSMEDILASIRRILNEEEPPATSEAPNPTPVDDDVLVLDQSMMVAADEAQSEGMAAEPDPEPDPEPEPPATTIEPPHQESVPVSVAPPKLVETQETPPSTFDLVAPEAAAAAASSVSSLVRTLTAGRGTQVYSGGPTLEDMVRAELRPLLKEWLDTNLPPLVERLVRTEIERVVGRAVP